MPQKTRAYLYRIATAVVPIAVGYGIIDDQKAALWLGLAGAVLATGTAAVNTSTKSDAS